MGKERNPLISEIFVKRGAEASSWSGKGGAWEVSPGNECCPLPAQGFQEELPALLTKLGHHISSQPLLSPLNRRAEMYSFALF